jgi:phosphoglycerate dehydrogenase-like enzyme
VHIAGAGVGDLPDAVFEDERVVTCSRGAMATPISEFVLSSMLAFEKRFPFSWIEKPPPHGWGYAGELDPSTAESRFEPPPRWGYAELGTLDGRVLGIFGFGSIGRETARKAIPFGMTVLAVRRTAAGVASEGVETVTLEEMVGRSDHVVIAASATPATFHAFDARVFNAMKRGAHLVNIARGSFVDQDALLSALDEGIVAFASLDVTDPEPLPAGHPLYAHPKVHLTPHISWCSPLKQRRTGEIVLENVEHYLRGEPLHGYVARDQRY